MYTSLHWLLIKRFRTQIGKTGYSKNFITYSILIFIHKTKEQWTTCHITSKQRNDHPRLRASANQLNCVERIWERTTNPLLSSVPANRKLIRKYTMGIVIWLVYSQLFNWHGLMYHYYARWVEGGKILTEVGSNKKLV